jgi:acyl carrier protein
VGSSLPTSHNKKVVITLSDISNKIKNIINRHLNVGMEMLSDDTHLRSLPDMSSLKVLEIILDIEELFGIKLDDEVTVNVQTIGQLCGEIDKLLQSNNRLAGNA